MQRQHTNTYNAIKNIVKRKRANKNIAAIVMVTIINILEIILEIWCTNRHTCRQENILQDVITLLLSS